MVAIAAFWPPMNSFGQWKWLRYFKKSYEVFVDAWTFNGLELIVGVQIVSLILVVPIYFINLRLAKALNKTLKNRRVKKHAQIN